MVKSLMRRPRSKATFRRILGPMHLSSPVKTVLAELLHEVEAIHCESLQEVGRILSPVLRKAAMAVADDDLHNELHSVLRRLT